MSVSLHLLKTIMKCPPVASCASALSAVYLTVVSCLLFVAGLGNIGGIGLVAALVLGLELKTNSFKF